MEKKKERTGEDPTGCYSMSHRKVKTETAEPSSLGSRFCFRSLGRRKRGAFFGFAVVSFSLGDYSLNNLVRAQVS